LSTHTEREKKLFFDGKKKKKKKPSRNVDWYFVIALVKLQHVSNAPASSSPPKRENGFLPTAPEDEFICLLNLLARALFVQCEKREREQKKGHSLSDSFVFL
jgi:hypothetical protein